MQIDPQAPQALSAATQVAASDKPSATSAPNKSTQADILQVDHAAEASADRDPREQLHNKTVSKRNGDNPDVASEQEQQKDSESGIDLLG